MGIKTSEIMEKDKNHWVLPDGRVYSGSTCGAWHTKFAMEYLENDDNLADRFDNWCDVGSGYIHDFFEQEMRWVRYCCWGNIGWVFSSHTRLTKKQKEKIFELTGTVVE